MTPAEPSPPQDLKQALVEMLRHPVRTIVPPWSWKAAFFSAFVRALTFFIINLSSGTGEATKAMLIEAAFATAAAGLLGAISQHLRQAKPLWATALTVWIGMPAVMVLAQYGVHRLAGTPHISGGIIVAFWLAAFASAFSWYAMRHGAMLGGDRQTTLRHDARSLPGISLDFVLAGPRLLRNIFRRRERRSR